MRDSSKQRYIDSLKEKMKNLKATMQENEKTYEKIFEKFKILHFYKIILLYFNAIFLSKLNIIYIFIF